MSDYFELLEDEQQYLDILIEGYIKTGGGAGVGALAGRVAGYKVASHLLSKGKISPETAKKIKNASTAGGAALGAAAANQKRIRRAVAADKAERDVELDEGTGSALAGGALGYYAGKKLKLSDKGKAAMAAGGALAGAKASSALKKQKQKDIEMRRAYADRMRAQKAIAKQAQQAMKQRRQQYTEAEESDLSEDTFAKITARGTGGYAGKAKRTAEAAKKAKERALAFKKQMAKWKKEGH